MIIYHYCCSASFGCRQHTLHDCCHKNNPEVIDLGELFYEATIPSIFTSKGSQNIPLCDFISCKSPTHTVPHNMMGLHHLQPHMQLVQKEAKSHNIILPSTRQCYGTIKGSATHDTQNLKIFTALTKAVRNERPEDYRTACDSVWCTFLTCSALVRGNRGRPCGNGCYDLFAGQKCFPGGLICISRGRPCGNKCYDPFIGQKCFPGGLICGSRGRPCGNKC